MKEYLGKKVLITTSNWFYGKDGRQYKTVYGTLNGVYNSKETFGFDTSRSHANWFIEIGSMLIMGCQVMYCVQTDNAHLGEVDDWEIETNKETNKKETYHYKRPTTIYLAD